MNIVSQKYFIVKFKLKLGGIHRPRRQPRFEGGSKKVREKNTSAIWKASRWGKGGSENPNLRTMWFVDGPLSNLINKCSMKDFSLWTFYFLPSWSSRVFCPKIRFQRKTLCWAPFSFWGKKAKRGKKSNEKKSQEILLYKMIFLAFQK